jgi:hypothetical protein
MLLNKQIKNKKIMKKELNEEQVALINAIHAVEEVLNYVSTDVIENEIRVLYENLSQLFINSFK